MRSKRPGYGLGVSIDRPRFWRYCQITAAASRCRAKKANIPHSISARDIDELIIKQQFACAVSGIPLKPSSLPFGGPFAPSLDRIVPAVGYVLGNVRVVCQIVNVAMSDWGLEPLETLVQVMAMNMTRTKSKVLQRNRS